MVLFRNVARLRFPAMDKGSKWGALRARGLLGRHTLRLTPEGMRFVLFTLAVGIAAINTGNNLFYLLLAMLLSLVVMSGLLSEVSLRRLEFRRYVPPYLYANTPTAVSVSLANRKRHLPSYSLRLLDVVGRVPVDRGIRIPFIAPRSSVLAQYSLVATHRGRYRLAGFHVVTRFPFGLFEKTARYGGDDEILVCPELVPLPSDLWQDLTAMGQGVGLNRRGPGIALYNLREYRPGDDSRAIHWMTTARTSKLMLKETEADDQHAITLLLSTVAPATHEVAFERAISVMASLAVHFHEQGYRLQACIGDEEVTVDGGDEHCLAILESLALCQRREPGDGIAIPRCAMDEDGRGFAVAVQAWADRETEAVAQAADCVISTDGTGEPTYVTRTRLSP